MTTWQDIAIDSRDAAKELLRTRRYRSAVSRSYYAAYSMVTARLVDQGDREFGRFMNPAHAELPKLIKNSLTPLSMSRRREVSTLIRRLRMYRELADYRPAQHLSEADCIDALRSMILVDRLFGGAS